MKKTMGYVKMNKTMPAACCAANWMPRQSAMGVDLEINGGYGMEYRIAAISGDGIGPEIVREAKKVLDRVGVVYGHTFRYDEVLMGGISIDTYGVPLTDEALETARKSDSVLLGAVGGDVGNSRWYDVAPNLRPEAGLLAIRKGLNLFANIRPAYLYDGLHEACPLKKEIIGSGFDMVIVRELTGGLYFGVQEFLHCFPV